MQILILIGGIASGKSTALKTFRELEIACFSADEVARECVAIGTPCYHAIVAKCGPNIIDKTGMLKRAELRKKMLEDNKFKLWLESLLHSEIRKHLIERAALAPSPYCVLEIPLLKNKADYPRAKVIYIHTPKVRQRAFLKQRDLSEAEIESLLAIQIPVKTNLNLADTVIENNGTLEALKDKIIAIHQQMITQKKP